MFQRMRDKEEEAREMAREMAGETAGEKTSTQNSLDPVMTQSQVENAAKLKNVLKNAVDESPAMTSASPKCSKGNVNLSGIPKDNFFPETSIAALDMLPQHQVQFSEDPAVRHSQEVNEGNAQNLIEKAVDGSSAMASKEFYSRKKNKKRKRPKTICYELATPPQHSDQNSLDPVMEQSQVETAAKLKNVLKNAVDKSPAMTSASPKCSKGNVDLSGIPKDNFFPEISISALDMLPQHQVQFSMDTAVRHSQEVNEGNAQNLIEKAVDGSSAMASKEVYSRKKNKKRKGQKTKCYELAIPPQHSAQNSLDPVMRQSQVENSTKLKNVLENTVDKSPAMTSASPKCSKGNVNLSCIPKDSFFPETSVSALDMLPQHQFQLSVDPAVRHSQEVNEGNAQNLIEKAVDGSSAMAREEVYSGKKNKKRKRSKTKCYDTERGRIDSSLSEVPKGTISSETSPTIDRSSAMTSAEVNSGKKNKIRKRQKSEHNAIQSNSNFQNEFVPEVIKLNSVQGKTAHLSLVSKQDDCSRLLRYALHSSGSITSYSKKHLLVLDLNGLLADFVRGVPKGYRPDRMISRKAVFRRPFCEDFLQFCFERFHLGIWSSRIKKNVLAAVKFLMLRYADKLLFRWDRSKCTKTRFFTIEDKKKPLLLKELSRLWKLPEYREFNQSNTLLLDDSPYKALRNPMHTAIFPYSYQYYHFDDTSLGPGGDIRVYLEGLAMADNVQEYVASHPFGQPAITESHPDWHFYQQILNEGNTTPLAKQEKVSMEKNEKKVDAVLQHQSLSNPSTE